MKLYYGANALAATRSARPRFSRHRGRSWDRATVRIDGREVTMWFDSTWGRRYYFTLDDSRWWSLPIWLSWGSLEFAYLAPLSSEPPKDR
jgi:hypothetical protein